MKKLFIYILNTMLYDISGFDTKRLDVDLESKEIKLH